MLSKQPTKEVSRWDVSALQDPVSRIVLAEVRGKPAVTKAEIEYRTGLSRPTVAQRVRELLEANLVVNTTEPIFSGGRPASGVRFNREGALILSVDVGERSTRVALLNAATTIFADTKIAMPVGAPPKELLAAVIAAADNLLGETAMTRSDLTSVGMGLPAPVDYASGMTLGWSVMSSWVGFDIRGFLQEEFGVPVRIDNDVNLLTLAEFQLHWPKLQHLLYVKAGTGVGSGLIVGGLLNRGAQGAAGDIGHIQLKGHGDPVCRCGNTGCVESHIGGWALADRLGATGGDANAVVDLVQDNDTEAIRALRDGGRMLGEAVAMAASLLNPSAIIVGGVLGSTGDHLLAGVREVVYRQTLPLATRNLVVKQSSLGKDGGIIGAGLLAVEELLASNI